MKIITVDHSNVDQYGFFCLKNKKAEGYKAKRAWLDDRFQEGLRIKMALDEDEKPIGFLEYIPGEYAWRPVNAKGYLFIHCIFIHRKEHKGVGIGQKLLHACVDDARTGGFKGVAAFTSKDAWITSKGLYQKLDFKEVDQKGKFELMVLSFEDAPLPTFRDWEKEQEKYQGLQVVFTNQCPYFSKSATDLIDEAQKRGIPMTAKLLDTTEAAQNAPSGYGTYTLLYNGKVIADKYVSRGRFKNILEKELE